MKRTSLYDTHVAAGATMVPFAGWDMPVSYTSTVAEVAAVRQGAGLFDVSHMGEARVTGPDSLAFVQHVTANDVTKLTPGKAQYSLLLNETGGIIDDIIVYCEGASDYLIVLNAGCHDKDYSWLEIQTQRFSNVTLADESAETALLALQGPEAVDLVGRVINEPRRFNGAEIDFYKLKSVKRFHFVGVHEYGMPLIISRTGYTGEDGFEIFCPWEDAPLLWDALVAAGATPAGLAARDVLRLEAAYPLYGHELDAAHRPQESGVAWAVKPAKGEFVGRSALEAAGTMQRLVGLRMDERAIPREHYPVASHDGEIQIGEVTSGTWSPTVKAGIAMARLEGDYAQTGTRVVVDIRGRRAGATVVPLPFYRNGV